MSEPKRYSVNRIGRVILNPRGLYILHEDYARLEQENAALKTALKHATDEVVDANLHWASKCEEADALKAENERLKAPVSDEEFGWNICAHNQQSWRSFINKLVAARAAKEPQ